jgi:hypothetical protein
MGLLSYKGSIRQSVILGMEVFEIAGFAGTYCTDICGAALVVGITHDDCPFGVESKLLVSLKCWLIQIYDCGKLRVFQKVSR